MSDSCLFLADGAKAAWSSVPVLGEAKFRALNIRSLKEEQCRIESFFVLPEK